MLKANMQVFFLFNYFVLRGDIEDVMGYIWTFIQPVGQHKTYILTYTYTRTRSCCMIWKADSLYIHMSGDHAMEVCDSAHLGSRPWVRDPRFYFFIYRCRNISLYFSFFFNKYNKFYKINWFVICLRTI